MCVRVRSLTIYRSKDIANKREHYFRSLLLYLQFFFSLHLSMTKNGAGREERERKFYFQAFGLEGGTRKETSLLLDDTQGPGQSLCHISLLSFSAS